MKNDETCNRRSSQENFTSETESSRLRPTLFVIPLPAILVGYAYCLDFKSTFEMLD